MLGVSEPLRMPWKEAWKVLPSWNCLHRVSSVSEYAYGWGEVDQEQSLTSVRGATCCGLEGHLTMPGLFSRMGLRRCTHCCRVAGVERGNGIPGNGDESGPRDAWQVDYAGFIWPGEEMCADPLGGV